jgi:transcriptional/translational regulatory protein YebC/TACO1
MSSSPETAEHQESHEVEASTTDDVEMSATATKHKLEKLMTDFATFDDVMRIGTRVSGRKSASSS